MFKKLLIIAGFCLSAQSAPAATVTLDFHGTINRTTGNPSPPIGVGEKILTRNGDNVVLSFTFDDAQRPTRVINSNSTSKLQYTSGSSTLYLKRHDLRLDAVPGSFQFASAALNPGFSRIGVTSTFRATYQDSFGIQSPFGTLANVSKPLNGLVSVADPSQLALASYVEAFKTSYMRTPSDFDTQIPIFRQTPSGFVFEPRIANMKVTDFFVNGVRVPNGPATPTPNPVPLPATGLLLIGGLFGLGALRRKVA